MLPHLKLDLGNLNRVSIPLPALFLLAAVYVSKSDTILVFLAEKTTALSYLSAALIIIFGAILLTDNVHVVSDLIYPYLGLH